MRNCYGKVASNAFEIFRPFASFWERYEKQMPLQKDHLFSVTIHFIKFWHVNKKTNRPTTQAPQKVAHAGRPNLISEITSNAAVAVDRSFFSNLHR